MRPTQRSEYTPLALTEPSEWSTATHRKGNIGWHIHIADNQKITPRDQKHCLTQISLKAMPRPRHYNLQIQMKQLLQKSRLHQRAMYSQAAGPRPETRGGHLDVLLEQEINTSKSI